MLKPSDIFVLAGLLANRDDWTYRSLAGDLGMSHPGVQRGLSRAAAAGLYVPERREVSLPAFEEFAVHALRFLVPGVLGAVVPGVPAAWAAEPVSAAIRSTDADLPPVWPSARGTVRGQALEPLHPRAVEAAADWPELARLLAILDSLRTGDVRVRGVSEGLLSAALRDATIEEAGKRLRRAAGESARVILFGSHARGDATARSDLDFLVVEPEVDDPSEESVRLRRALRGMRIAADVIVVSRDYASEWEGVRGSLVHRALAEGRVLSV